MMELVGRKFCEDMNKILVSLGIIVILGMAQDVRASSPDLCGMREDKLVSSSSLEGVQKWNKNFKRALSRGYFAGAMHAIDKGADPKITDEDGCTVLHLAAAYGDVDAIRFLIKEKGLDPNAKTTDNEFWAITPLFCADFDAGEWEETIRMLVEFGANINEVDHLGRTVLHFAGIRGKKELFDLFIELGADRSIKDNQGRTAEDLAKECGRFVTEYPEVEYHDHSSYSEEGKCLIERD